ncbi:MAG: hypothetical protein N2561_07160 [Bacteroidetes bacterium]|nr:hypothetical protein [Rhodothermia bacterium]MCS7155014.1 hypothetical protein [Bacteroidota bacterium]MCX7907298.1 hypothetical protein [Bacteroidota bacterium]MDW8137975.1 hypothetical protein [Bacteroidota bacterium]MDW8286173.1 hypothetical protein [Bacteroidota bacterium]
MEPMFWIIPPPPAQASAGRLWVEVRYGHPEADGVLPPAVESALVRARIWAERAQELDVETLRLSINAQRKLGFYVSPERPPLALGLYYDLGYYEAPERPALYVHCYAQSFLLGPGPKPSTMPVPHLSLRLLPSGWPQPGRPWLVRLEFFNRPAAGARLQLIGAHKTAEERIADAEGLVEMAPLEPGSYGLLAVVRLERSGTVRGRPYEAIEHRATLWILCEEGD